MKQTRFLFPALVCVLLVCSCTIEMVQTPESVPPEGTPIVPSTSGVPVTHVPITWPHLNLSGKLVYLNSTMDGGTLISKIQMLDLLTGDIATLFSVSPAWIYYVTISPDRRMLVMSYSPPRQPNSSSSRSLYKIPLDGSVEPQPLFTPPNSSDRYTQAEWSPDGKYIYYVHYNQDERAEGQLLEDYDLSRMTYPEGEQEKIAEHAFWPRLSSDSSRLVFVFVDPNSGRNELYIANADGSNPRRIALSGAQTPEIIDAPVFAPDGQSILFSAPEPVRAYQPDFFERLLGVQVAKAHSVPSDWWSVPVTGGEPTRLTNIQSINLFASVSPDQKHIASLNGEGLFVMDLDGSNLTQVLVDSGVHGTVTWIP